ncbi:MULTISPECIES: hypothetical protein [unclassified Mycoplasma]|uniref:hypothetical protein n=1 Tax=unclassified Mycoplasma TaxID=2683645 RepID=UPI00211D08B0|nr:MULTISPECIES: hypothetical protein [unclassified Mycoplasma]UUM19860.1 hypothetical protein NPA11_00250 [Mycoplasma sp. 1578d]UUM24844.1 hypothetical protein NPA12_00250 [Mycoplasma sp. 3686d]
MKTIYKLLTLTFTTVIPVSMVFSCANKPNEKTKNPDTQVPSNNNSIKNYEIPNPSPENLRKYLQGFIQLSTNSSLHEQKVKELQKSIDKYFIPSVNEIIEKDFKTKSTVQLKKLENILNFSDMSDILEDISPQIKPKLIKTLKDLKNLVDQRITIIQAGNQVEKENKSPRGN